MNIQNTLFVSGLILMMSFGFSSTKSFNFENLSKKSLHTTTDTIKHQVIISGNFHNAKNTKITLYKKPFHLSIWKHGLIKIGGSTIDSLGDYRITIDSLLEPALYQIHVDSSNSKIFPMNGTEKNIQLSGVQIDCKQLQISFKGAEEAKEYLNLKQSFRGESELKLLVDRIQETPHVIAAAYALQTRRISIFHSYGIYQSIADKLELKYPESIFAKEFKNFVTNNAPQTRINAPNILRKKIAVGKQALEITLPNPEGELLSLSDLKGQIVLLNFWASWCGPCRRHNPEIVELYNKYKEDGFTVFSVSIDGLDERSKAKIGSQEEIEKQMQLGKKNWIEAIENDKLSWPYHVSDLKKWDSEAMKLYEISSTPKMYLIDRSGNFAAINPRKDLEIQLKKLLK